MSFSSRRHRAARLTHRAAQASAKPHRRLHRVRRPAEAHADPPRASVCIDAHRGQHMADCRTLPDEHAAPALTATPSRSSAITTVSADSPGTANSDRVRQAASRVAPKITASGASRSSSASKRSRNVADMLHLAQVGSVLTAAPKPAIAGDVLRAGAASDSCPPPRSAARAARRRARRARPRLAGRRSCARERHVVRVEMRYGILPRGLHGIDMEQRAFAAVGDDAV